MNDQDFPSANFDRFLGELGDYVILRNPQMEEHLKAGGDIDILVKSQEDATISLVAELGRPRYVAARSYIRSFFFDWGQVDLWPRLEWHGAVFLPTETVLEAASTNPDGHRVPRPAHEGVAAWLTSLLWGGFVKERYAELLHAAWREDASEFRRCLDWAFGRRLGSAMVSLVESGCSTRAVELLPQLRRGLMLRSIGRAPLATSRGWAGFWLVESRMRFVPPVPSVAILGPDGSGKSSVIERLKSDNRLLPRPVSGVRIVHWRPGVLRRRAASPISVPDPHAKPPYRLPRSIFQLGILLVDWWLGYPGLNDLRAKRVVILHDRHIADLLVDPARYRYGGPRWVAKAAVAGVPKPTLTFVLDAPAQVLQKRKQEVSFAESTRQRVEYERLATSLGATVLDATLTPDLLASQIGKAIGGWLSKRLTLKRFGEGSLR